MSTNTLPYIDMPRNFLDHTVPELQAPDRFKLLHAVAEKEYWRGATCHSAVDIAANSVLEQGSSYVSLGAAAYEGITGLLALEGILCEPVPPIAQDQALVGLQPSLQLLKVGEKDMRGVMDGCTRAMTRETPLLAEAVDIIVRPYTSDERERNLALVGASLMRNLHLMILED